MSVRATARRAAVRAVAVGAAAAIVVGVMAVVVESGCEAAPSIRISPSRIEKHVRRFLFFEDRSLGPFKVVNSGTSPLRVRVCVEDLFQTEDGSAVFVTDGSYQFGAAELVSLEPTEFLLEPGKTQLVKGTVDTGSKRTGGGYCVVFFETQPEPEGIASMATASRVGALVYIVFAGPVQVRGSVDRLDVQDLGQGVASVRVLLRNEGDVHISPRGTIRIKTTGGSLVCDGSVSPANILPSATRWLEGTVSLPSDIGPGRYVLEVTMLLTDTKTAYAEAALLVRRSDGGRIEVSLDQKEK